MVIILVTRDEVHSKAWLALLNEATFTTIKASTKQTSTNREIGCEPRGTPVTAGRFN